MTEITLGGDEKNSVEKLTMALSYCVEASRAGHYRSTIEAVRHGIEAATELGTHRSDGRWAIVATQMDHARVALTRMTSAMFMLQSLALATQFENMKTTVQRMVARRLVH
jgi:ABC-type amino acid transport system permease subunit